MNFRARMERNDEPRMSTIDRVANAGRVDLEGRKAAARWALQETSGNTRKAAELLAMSRSSFWYQLRKLGLAGEPRRVREEIARTFVVD